MAHRKYFFIQRDYAFQDESPVFLFSNENIAGTFKTLGNIDGKNILTVASSGDYAFDAYLAGAKNVDTFDINSFQKHVMELKSCMIKRVDYYSFLKFFFSKTNFFNQDLIKPAKNILSDELKCFLELYNNKKRDLFRYRQASHPDFCPWTNLNYLKTENNYYALRKVLPEKINFMHCDLMDVSANFSQKYDIILLSNIFDYVFTEQKLTQNRMMCMYNQILVPLAEKNLNHDNGQICFQYMWEGNSLAWGNFLEFFKKHLTVDKPHTFAVRSVNSAFGYDGHDVILIMRQNQKTK